MGPIDLEAFDGNVKFLRSSRANEQSLAIGKFNLQSPAAIYAKCLPAWSNPISPASEFPYRLVFSDMHLLDVSLIDGPEIAKIGEIPVPNRTLIDLQRQFMKMDQEEDYD